ncbi:hypothetical protein [Plesiomonas shigelloides]|uniref:hypothetical protein n=1 Tax=Plesiomonas shigelloides TaxID=703 RepID=UPI0012618BF9|nr:hypothetical protein [Plesiomonas shigelloides]KAB7694367.1 hypothetical protein GBN15_15100 [Plesiomonas shigelloides]
MNEINLLRSMWKDRTKRSTQLIVKGITFNGETGSLNNTHWKYEVGYSFRDALDLKYEQRMKNKKPYMVWTQGPIVCFKEGDVINSTCKTKALQVKFSDRMGWDTTKNEMYEGSVTYTEYSIENNSLTLLRENRCTQMEFLELLIYGNTPNTKM